MNPALFLRRYAAASEPFVWRLTMECCVDLNINVPGGSVRGAGSMEGERRRKSGQQEERKGEEERESERGEREEKRGEARRGGLWQDSERCVICSSFHLLSCHASCLKKHIPPLTSV